MSHPPRVIGALVGTSRRNGIPELTAYHASGPRLTPAQREAALRKLVEDRNAALRQRRAGQLVTAWHRDVPRTCTCQWTLAAGSAFAITQPDPDCPYHPTREPVQPATEPEAAQRRAELLEANPGGAFRPGHRRARKAAAQ